TGVPGYSGDGGPAALAQLFAPRAVAISKNGDLYLADGYNFRIRKVSRSGVITTVAGNGTTGLGNGPFLSYSGDGGPATSATIGHIFGLALDPDGNLYIAEL